MTIEGEIILPHHLSMNSGFQYMFFFIFTIPPADILIRSASIVQVLYGLSVIFQSYKHTWCIFILQTDNTEFMRNQ